MTISVGEVAMVNLDAIQVGERARKEMGDLNEIELSMKESGLISPLAVKDCGQDGYYLLAGERRYTVLKKNEVISVPVRVYPADISDIEVKSIELAENFYRKDFEYWEYDNLVMEVHKLQQQIHGAKAPGPSDQGWSVENTGDMVGASKGHVSVAIKRAEAREAFPELFDQCKTQSDATKIIKKIDEAIVKDVMAKRIESERTSPTFQQLAKAFVVRDFFVGVKEIPDSCMHLVEIDPPYGIDLQAAKKSDGESKYTSEHYNEVDSGEYQVFLAKLLAECYRVMTDHSWLLFWFAPEPWFDVVYKELNNAGFSTTRMCGIWTKPSGQSKRPEMHLANTYEMFFYAWKGRPALNKAGRGNNFVFPPVSPQQKTHPTERPVELMREIYDTFAFPGSRVFIPFLGSGNGLIAAHELGMSPLGFELSKAYRDSFLVKVYRS